MVTTYRRTFKIFNLHICVAGWSSATALMTNPQMIRNFLFIQRGLLTYYAVNKTRKCHYLDYNKYGKFEINTNVPVPSTCGFVSLVSIFL